MLQTCKMHPKIKVEQKNNVHFHTLVHCGRTCEDLRPEPFLTDGASDQAQIPANDSTNRREYQQTTRIRWHPQNLKVTEGRKKNKKKNPQPSNARSVTSFLKLLLYREAGRWPVSLLHLTEHRAVWCLLISNANRNCNKNNFCMYWFFRKSSTAFRWTREIHLIVSTWISNRCLTQLLTQGSYRSPAAINEGSQT